MANPSKKKRRKGARARRRSARRRSLLPNPVKSLVAGVTSGPREVIKSDFAVEAAAVAIGFVAPAQVLMRLPASMIDARWKAYLSKTGLILLGAWGAGKAFGPKARRGVLIGGAVGLGIDLWVDYVSPWLSRMSAGAPTPAGQAGVGHYLEDRGMGHYLEQRGVGDDLEVGDAAEVFGD